MKINSFKIWDWVILQNVFISSFFIEINVMTQILHNIVLCMDWYDALN